MRKLLALLISATLMLSLVTCGDSGTIDNRDVQSQNGNQMNTSDDDVQFDNSDVAIVFIEYSIFCLSSNFNSFR